MQSYQEKLKQIQPLREEISDISKDEYGHRIKKLCALLDDEDVDLIYLHAGVNLYYFTGISWNPSERLCGALIHKNGHIDYILPHFELATFKQQVIFEADFLTWHEDQSPFHIIDKLCADYNRIALDPNLPFGMVSKLHCATREKIVSGESIIVSCRIQKSSQEIAIIQQAMKMTQKVIELAKSILVEGIHANEVAEFIDKAHQKIGADNGAYFCIVLFGKDSSYPHGVKNPKRLEKGDVVLIDTGCRLYNYHSDITRSFLFDDEDNNNDKIKQVWQIESQAQHKALESIEENTLCEKIDYSARDFITQHGFGPDYQLPGLAHRTGHGIGLEIHEPPYIVRGNLTPVLNGMCFSIEPMICVPEEFGIRLEDCVFIQENKALWFTEPAQIEHDYYVGYADKNGGH